MVRKQKEGGQNVRATTHHRVPIKKAKIESHIYFEIVEIYWQ
jgi:hypothetical protein